MKFLISIGNLDKNILYIIFAGLTHIFLKYILTKDKSNLEEYPLILSLESSMGMSLSFILLFIYKNGNKKNKKNNIKNIGNDNEVNIINNSEKSNSIKYEYKNAYKNIIYGKYKYILLTSILDCIQTIISFFIYFKIKINMWIFDIIFITFFSHLFLKTIMHRHHYISICLFILIGITIDIIAGYYNNFFDNIINISLKMFNEIISSLIIVIMKYTIEIKFSKAYEICFYQGLFTFIKYSILVSFFCIYADYILYFQTFNIMGLIIFFSIMIMQFIINLFALITNEKTNPFYIIIIIIISELGYHIIDFMKDFKLEIERIIIIIGLFLIFLINLIFNEILEINCCGLEKNTKKNIIIRSKADIINIIYEENNSSQYSDENDSNTFEEEEKVTEISELNKDNNG